MASEQFSLCWDNFHKNMSSGMNSLLENEDLVDVTLAVEGKCLKAHKMVLSVCSPYFKELFKSNPCQHPIVFMKDVSYVAISDLLQFMYQGEVQVSQENLTTFIKTAEALQIKGLTADGNGSMDADAESVQEKSVTHHIEEYKPTPRLKKQAPTPIVTATPATKRPRLSVSSNDSQPLPSSITKTEPMVSATGSSVGDPPIQFKMEPYDSSQAVTIPDESGDDNFGDETLDDNTVDDTEDYSMMEGTEEEPQAGTSTDGAGEGQEDRKNRKWNYQTPLIPMKRVGIFDMPDGYLYRKTKKLADKWYLKCAFSSDVNCKASYVVDVDEFNNPGQNYRCVIPHNHPPNELAVQTSRFLKELERAVAVMPGSTRQIFDVVVESYPEVKKIYSYNNVVGRMHHWLKKYSIGRKRKEPSVNEDDTSKEEIVILGSW